MLIRSISSGLAMPTLQATALSRISRKSSSLRFSESFLESFSRRISQSLGRITAPATTGPAKGPRPASSTPQIRLTAA